VELDCPIAVRDAAGELVAELIGCLRPGGHVGVGRYPVAVATEELPASQADALAQEIPESDVERANRRDQSGLLARVRNGEGVELRPVTFDVARVLAEERGPQVRLMPMRPSSA
jgi:hypothetical protein